MKRATEQEMIARAKLVRKVRRLIGKGRTDVERGGTDMFFDRGFKSHQRALLKLTVAFGTPKTETATQLSGKRVPVWHVFTDSKTGREISLSTFRKDTNNYVSICYM